jgi:truncated hemoglobin YjbI
MGDQTTGGGLSDYDIVGGGSAVGGVVNDFYERVLGDPQLAPYFEGVDLARLKRHQVLLISQVLGARQTTTDVRLTRPTLASESATMTSPRSPDIWWSPCGRPESPKTSS